MNKISKRPRESGIELLKIIAMFMIVISHLVQTYGSIHSGIGIDNSYFYDLNIASAGLNNRIMLILRHFGAIGNNIFFICSAWFLVDNNRVNNKKVINMIFNVWVIAVSFLAVFTYFNVDISKGNIRKSLLPTTFAANWYITVYILIYLMHPALNLIINKFSKRQLLTSCIILLFLYSFVAIFYDNRFYTTSLLIFVMLYIIVGYVKRYCTKYTDNLKLNLILLISSIILFVAFMWFYDSLGLKYNYFKKRMLFYNNSAFILIILMAFSAFFVFKNKVFVNKFINYWSSLTLFIYIIHENVLFRIYARPYIFVFIKDHFGYKYISVLTVAAAVLLFLATSIVSLLYKQTVGRLVTLIANFFYDKIFHPICSRVLDVLGGK